MKNIAVIGAGTMGNGIAHTFAQNGYRVQLIDINEYALKNGIQTISNNLDRMLQKELISREKKIETLNNITTFTSVSDGVEYASLVVEAATENKNIKLKLFKELDIACPDDTILATNTSSISITKIASVTNRANQVIGMHFMNPVPIMKLVEVINGKDTSSSVTDSVLEAAERMGKIPLMCNDSPGFVSNRILCPMINEAILTLQEGVAEPEAIDGIMKLGMNHPIGPLALSDLIGNDTVLHIMNVLHEGLADDKYAPAQLLIEMVEQGKLGRKSGQGFYNY